MTNAAAEVSLSRLELVVLARLSDPKPPGERKLAEDVAALALPDHSQAQATELVRRTLSELHDRTLINRPRITLTSKGEQQLRRAIDLPSSVELPRWSTIRDEHLAMMQLGLSPSSADARKLLTKGESLAVGVLRTALKHPNVTTLEELCDALLTDALGFSPTGMRLGELRAHMLAKCAGVATAGDMADVANNAAKKHLGTSKAGKRPFGRALAQRWAYQNVQAPKTVNVHAEEIAQPSSPRVQAGPSGNAPVVPPPEAALLTLVREAIPRVGSDGRFGAEKVFVSAIWKQIEHARRPLDMSLSEFKRWLVTANRKQLLDLARADLVSAMDPKLVAESEIDDFGTRFHFVVDRQLKSQRGAHAR